MSSIQFQPCPDNDFMEYAMVGANGLEFYIERGGQAGKPVIWLIMGLGMQKLGWPDEFCKQLINQGFQVYRYDNRDIGLSTKITQPRSSLNVYSLMGRAMLGLQTPGAVYNLYDMAQDALRLMDALGVQQAHVLGASMGGMIAQILAAKYPDRIKSLNVLFSSNLQAFLPPPAPQQLMAIMAPAPKTKDKTVIIDDGVKRFKAVGSPAPYFDEQIARQTVTQSVNRMLYRAGVLRHIMAVFSTGSLAKLNYKIKAPTLILHGQKDRLLWPAAGKAIHKSIKHSKFYEIPNMGHDLMPYFIPELVQRFADNMRQSA